MDLSIIDMVTFLVPSADLFAQPSSALLVSMWSWSSSPFSSRTALLSIYFSLLLTPLLSSLAVVAFSAVSPACCSLLSALLFCCAPSGTASPLPCVCRVLRSTHVWWHRDGAQLRAALLSAAVGSAALPRGIPGMALGAVDGLHAKLCVTSLVMWCAVCLETSDALFRLWLLE